MMKKHYSVLVRLLLGCLFVINALRHSSATDILGQKENQKELEATRISFMFAAKKETPEGREAQYHVRKLGFGEKRSMMIHNKESNTDLSVKEKGSSQGGRGTSSKISAEDEDAVNKSMGRFREEDDQKKGDQSSKNTNSKDSQINKPNQEAHDKGTDTQKDKEKAKRSFQAEEGVMNFIHMDYKGMAHRKPPINNQEPRN